MAFFRRRKMRATSPQNTNGDTSGRRELTPAQQLQGYPDTVVDPRRAEFMAIAETTLQGAAGYARYVEITDPSAEERQRAGRIGRAMLEDAARMAEAAGLDYDVHGSSDIGLGTLLGTTIKAVDPRDPTQ